MLLSSDPVAERRTNQTNAHTHVFQSYPAHCIRVDGVLTASPSPVFLHRPPMLEFTCCNERLGAGQQKRGKHVLRRVLIENRAWEAIA
jgi:hypothetical protein